MFLIAMASFLPCGLPLCLLQVDGVSAEVFFDFDDSCFDLLTAGSDVSYLILSSWAWVVFDDSRPECS